MLDEVQSFLKPYPPKVRELALGARELYVGLGSAPSLAAVNHRPAGNIEAIAREVLVSWAASPAPAADGAGGDVPGGCPPAGRPRGRYAASPRSVLRWFARGR